MSRNRRGLSTARTKGGITWKGRASVNHKLVGAYFATEIPSMIVRRTFLKSRDRNDVPFAPYSWAYREKRVDMGEKADRVYLHLTGGLMRSISALKRKTTQTALTVTIGARPTRSRIVTTMPDGGKGHYVETGKWGPRHNQILYFLGPGAKSNKRREILGLTPKERSAMAKAIPKLPNVLQTKARA